MQCNNNHLGQHSNSINIDNHRCRLSLLVIQLQKGPKFDAITEVKGGGAFGEFCFKCNFCTCKAMNAQRQLYP